MIIEWSEYTHGGKGPARRHALHGASASGHSFHICADDADSAVELWREAAGGLTYIGAFPSETAARIRAEQLAAAG